MDETWYMKVEAIVFDKIKKKSEPVLKPVYPNIIFTTSEVTEKPSQFPCVEIRELPGVEKGNTLVNDEVSAYLSTFQVNVYSEISKQVARDVMAEIALHFKRDIAFSMVAMPTYTKFDGIHRYTARFRRMLGGGDKL